MESTATHEREVQIIRYAPFTCRPHSPRQSPWRAPLPKGVKEIVERSALDRFFSESYAIWASSFALLTKEFVAEVVRSVPVAQPLGWTCYKFVDCCSCQVGEDYLWVQKHDSGWTIELCYPDNADPDARILTIENMPVLCADGGSAGQLAKACYPHAAANLAWHPYW